MAAAVRAVSAGPTASARRGDPPRADEPSRRMATVVVVHGAGPRAVDPEREPLIAHLRGALAGGCVVRAPRMPAPERPTYRAWSAALREVLDAADDPPLLVGHSLGGSVLLKHLTDAPSARPIRGLFLVAAPYWGARDWAGGDFALRAGYASALPADVPVFLYHGRDDAAVPVAHALRYGSEIPHAVVRLLDGCGHGFDGGLPELVADIAGCARSLTTNHGRARTPGSTEAGR